jgi:multiple sugar transport system substrate-binding protein
VIKLTYGTFAEATQLEEMSKITKRFDELFPEYEVEIQARPWGQYWESLEVQVAGGVAPDVSWMTPNYAYHFFKGGQLVDITDFLERDGISLSDYVGELMEAKFEGRYYGMPYGNGAIVWVYNKDLFDEAGLSYPTEEWTWDDFADAAKKLTKEEGGQKTQWGMNIENWTEAWGYLPLGNRAWHYSGAVFTDKGGYFDASQPIRCTATDPAFMQAFQWLQERICKEGVIPKAGEITLAPGIEFAFNTGVIGMSFSGTWMMGGHRKVQFNWDLCLVPKSPFTGERRTTSYALPHSIFKVTKQLEGAWQLIKWHAQQEAQEMLAVSGVKEPMLKSALEKLSGTPEHFKEVVMRHYLDFNWNMSTMVFDGQPEAESQFASYLDYIWTCERTIEEVAPEAEEAVNAILQSKQAR